jgi:hypothetical protein
MVDEKLNVITHDMEYVNYDETTVSGIDQVRQNLKIRLLGVKGEFFENTTLGNIDFDAMAKKKGIAVFDAANKATIKDTPGVLSIVSYSSSYNTQQRIMDISFVAQTIYGRATLTGLQVAL